MDSAAMFVGGLAYERFMGRWSRQLADLFVKSFPIVDGDSVLDIGCGTGAAAFAVAASTPSARIVGVDPSATFLAQARALVADRRIQFVIGDACALPVCTATFDRTLSLLVMNFLPDRNEALDEMIRVTRPGGSVAAAVWDYGDGMQMLRLFWDEAVARDSSIGARDERHMPLCRSGELGEFWQAHGLEDVEEALLTIDLRFASFEDYWLPFLDGLGPAGAYAASLSVVDRADLEKRLRHRLGRERRDGSMTLQGRAWIVQGTVPAGLSIGGKKRSTGGA